MSRQESHRIYLQVFAPRGNNVNDTQIHPTYASATTTTTSAAVRLTDKARTQDVTALLRGKFGLPRILNNNKETGRETYPSLQKRLSHSESSSSRQYSFQHSDNDSIDG